MSQSKESMKHDMPPRTPEMTLAALRDQGWPRACSLEPECYDGRAFPIAKIMSSRTTWPIFALGLGRGEGLLMPWVAMIRTHSPQLRITPSLQEEE